MSRGTSADRGAAALEFALVVPILLVLVFGIMDFGIFFADSLAVQSAVREGARQAVVLRCDSAPFSAACIATLTKNQTDAIAGGTEYVKVVSSDPWKNGGSVTVCAVVQVAGVTGFTPLPNGSTTRAKITMRIEQDQPQPSAAVANYAADPVPPGGWGFCS
jgi:Flp pilus assembly protein TadG